MRIFISGQITGIPYRQVFKRFAKAKEKLLHSVTAKHIFMNVINPLDSTTERLSPQELMKKRIEDLMSCECLYSLNNCDNSQDAMLEREIAQQIGLEIWDEL